jgi:hypothetical protein
MTTIIPATTATLHQGDCLDVLRSLPAGSVDAIVTDPPAGIAFMGKGWDGARGGRLQWAGWLSERLAEARRVAKPGAYALVWALPRTSHWTGCAIEDAGWRITDRLAHVFGSGFPKHKSKLKPAVEDWWLAWNPDRKATPLPGLEACRVAGVVPSVPQPSFNSPTGQVYGFKTGEGRNGEMSQSPARWPPNLLLQHSEGCERVGTKRVKSQNPQYVTNGRGSSEMFHATRPSGQGIGHADPDGRETVEDWRCVDGCPVKLMGEQSGERKSGGANGRRSNGVLKYGGQNGRPSHDTTTIETVGGIGATSGTAARFYPQFTPDPDPFLYAGKSSRRDRGEGNTHPTVKPQMLMRWLCRLVTPPGGTVLDCFAGSGSTGVAALAEGFGFVGIERDPGYLKIARRRIAAASTPKPLPASA